MYLYFDCLLVSPSLPLVHFDQLLRYIDTRSVNIMKVYIERDNLQVELIRRRKFSFFYSHLLLRSSGSSNATSPTERKSGDFETRPLRLRF